MIKAFDGRNSQIGDHLGSLLDDLGYELLNLMRKHVDGDPRRPLLLCASMIAAGAILGTGDNDQLQDLTPENAMDQVYPYFLIGLSKTLADRVKAKQFHDAANREMSKLADVGPSSKELDDTVLSIAMGTLPGTETLQ